MCGIFGVTGDKDTTELLIHGLKRMEYRGYDSSGICLNNEELIRKRAVGPLSNLEPLVVDLPDSKCGIAHTRWATHGAPTVENAHPHVSSELDVAVVHNGIIENEVELRNFLKSDDKELEFESETDSELVAHLLSKELKKINSKIKNITEDQILSSWKNVIDKLEGSYALAAVISGREDSILFARKFAPLILSHDGKRGLLASDVSCVVGLSESVFYLEEGDWGIIKDLGVKIFNIDGDTVELKPKKLEWELGDAELGGYPTFMLKEIYEQPRVVRDCLRGRLSRDKIKGVKIPYHSGLAGHSDGDVILHSIIDAILGSIRKKDIGAYFPNTKKFKNIRSTKLLKPILEMLDQTNFYINNLDINLICQKPRVSKYRNRIVESISRLMNLNKDLINLKGKTVEKLGLIGKEEAIACEVIISIAKYD